MARTEVVRLEAARDKVTRAIVIRAGQQSEIRARVFVLVNRRHSLAKVVVTICQ